MPDEPVIFPAPKHAFISYSRKDTPFVERLEAELMRRGVTVWRDATSIPGGDDWYQNIITGLAEAYAIVCVVTAHADESKWVRREQLRGDEDNIPLIAVQPAPYRNPVHLQEVLPILMDDASFPAGLLALIAALGRCQAKPRRPPLSVLTPGATPTAAAPRINAAAVAEYLKWVLSDAKADLRDALYVDLAATPERQPEARVTSALAFGLDEDEFVFSTVGLEHLPHDDFTKAGEDVADARLAIRLLRRAVLLGDPGAGKTTTLLKFAVDLARAAQTDMDARLPIFVPLREFNGAQPFADFVRSKAN
ncbi:MAG: TIR domain-containing protein, partial [Chloroflexota bacterium]|nr:TIR domain-containing protein [Chloroflexota bacterium]